METGNSPLGNSPLNSSNITKLRYVYACRQNTVPDIHNGLYYGYGMNAYISGNKITALPYKYSQIPYVIEASRYYLPTSAGTLSNIMFPHFYQAGVLFFDGHIQSYKSSTMPIPGWSTWYYITNGSW